jgi:hypothetical protein
VPNANTHPRDCCTSQAQAEANVGKLRQDWAAKKASWLDMAG